MPSARSSRNVNSGGRLGSGKLVLLKGSVSSKNCTRQASVAMMHPCSGGRGPRNQRGRRPGRRGHCGPGRRRPLLAGSRAGRLRHSRLQPGLQPRGAGQGRGRRACGPLLLRLLPSGVPRAAGPAAPTDPTRRWELEGENWWRGIRSPAPRPLAVAGTTPLTGRRHLGRRLHVRPAAWGASGELHY